YERFGLHVNRHCPLSTQPSFWKQGHLGGLILPLIIAGYLRFPELQCHPLQLKAKCQGNQSRGKLGLVGKPLLHGFECGKALPVRRHLLARERYDIGWASEFSKEKFDLSHVPNLKDLGSRSFQPVLELAPSVAGDRIGTSMP